MLPTTIKTKNEAGEPWAGSICTSIPFPLGDWAFGQAAPQGGVAREGLALVQKALQVLQKFCRKAEHLASGRDNCKFACIKNTSV